MNSYENIVSLMDLTSLNDNDAKQSIITLCKKAQNKYGTVAAVCVYPQFIAVARQHTPSAVKIATVANFPEGISSLKKVTDEVCYAIGQGVNEIDLVINYSDYQMYNCSPKSIEMVKVIQGIIREKNIILKVIIESGELTLDQVKIASTDMVGLGVDFIKTSTGKTKNGYTVDAISAILTIIAKDNFKVGLKVSGGIRTFSHANEILTIVNQEYKINCITSKKIRLGVSSLLDCLLSSRRCN